jgi:CheY-like chemotaxis protein
VLGDPFRVKQILSNLLSNAVKFTERGTIFVSLTRECAPWVRRSGLDPDHCQLCYAVSDTGIGIARAGGEKLFAPFTQADNSTTRKFGGTGLGLVIIRELAQRMDGDVGFESEEGRGSTFWFRQRVELHHQPLARWESNPSAIARHHRGRLLLVEDNETNREISGAILQTLGCQVDFAHDGAQAVAAAAATRYDLILMDCQMPVMDGFEATRRIRAAEQAAGDTARPIIALTANADYLAKPISRAQLAAVLARHLSGRQVSQRLARQAPARSPRRSLPGHGERRLAMVFDPSVVQSLPMVADGSNPGFADRVLDMFDRRPRGRCY